MGCLDKKKKNSKVSVKGKFLHVERETAGEFLVLILFPF